MKWECMRAKCFDACEFLESSTKTEHHSVLPRTEMNTEIPSMSDREKEHEYTFFRLAYPMTHDRSFGKEFEMGEHENLRGMRGMGSETGVTEFQMSKPWSSSYESMSKEEEPVLERMQDASKLSSSFKPLFATNEAKEEKPAFERLMVSSFKPLFATNSLSNSNEDALSQREFSHWRY